MAICEKCGTRYTPSPEALDCPRCAQDGSGPMAAEPVARRSDAPKSSSISASPRGPVVVENRAASRPPQQRPQSRPQQQQPSSASRSGAAPERLSRGRAEAAAPRPTARAHVVVPERGLDTTAKIGLAAAGGLAVIVLIAWLVVKNKKDAEAAATKTHDEQVASLVDELKKLDIKDDAGANRILDRAKETEPLWKGDPAAESITSLEAQARQNLDTSKERKDIVDRFTKVQETLKTADQKSPADLLDARHTLDDLDSKAPIVGADFASQVTLAHTTAERAFAQRLLDDAKATDTANPDKPRQALVKFTLAEDELKKLLDKAYHDKDDASKQVYEDIYKKVIVESDRLASAVFSESTEGGLGWTDYLSGEHAKEWNPTIVQGFSHAIQAGVLSIVGPDPETKKQGILAIGDKEQWRNFVADIEFTIDKGGFDLAFRLGRGLSANVMQYPFRADGQGAQLEPGKSYHARASFLGSSLVVRFLGDAVPPVYEIKADWTTTRKGAIGIVVPPGARFKVTAFKVRELR